jgi:hypothetical protein
MRLTKLKLALSCTLLVAAPAACGSGALSAQAGGTTGTGAANALRCALQPAVDTSINGILVGIAAADLNGDGKLDLAVPHESDKAVLLLMNQGARPSPRRRPCPWVRRPSPSPRAI